MQVCRPSQQPSALLSAPLHSPVKMVFIMRQLKVQRVMYCPQLALRLSLALRRLYLGI